MTGHEAVQTWVVQSQRRHRMLNNSNNIVVSGGSFTVVHGHSITYEGQIAHYPTNSDAGIQGKKDISRPIRSLTFFLHQE